MTDPLRSFSTRSTPQTRRDPTRSDQVRNSAGGYVFQVDEWSRLRRFLVLGTDGGTYYATEAALTLENAQFVVKLVNRDRETGLRVVEELRIVSLENIAPRQKPTLFTLAIAASASDAVVRRAALDALPEICRTGTMLFNFIGYVQQFRGWGPSLRKAVARWYTEKPIDRLALQVVKYRQRDGWSHRDLLRKAHPTTTDPARDALFKWITHRNEFWTTHGDWTVETTHGDWTVELPDLVLGFENLSHVASLKPRGVVASIQDSNLPWEAVPDEYLRMPEVLEALIPNMGLTALTRQFGRIASTGHMTPGSSLEKLVLKRLHVPSAGDEKFIGQFLAKNSNAYVQSRVHPFQMLLAMTTYQAGHGVKGKLNWKPTSRIVDALDAGFYAAFGSVPKSDKRTLVALDVSGSMGWGNLLNTHITPRVASAAMALITLRANADVQVTAFSHKLIPIDISPRQRLDDVVRKVSGLAFGGTDCALPMVYALENRLEIDTFVVYTDNETWAGSVHPAQALRLYRDKVNPNARLAVVGMTATDFTIADPTDPGQLDVVGFDGSAPRVLQDFSEGVL